MHRCLRDGRARTLALALAVLMLNSVSCAPAPSPTWTPPAAQRHSVVWSLAGTSDQGGALFNRPSDPKLRQGPVLARVTCDVESLLHLAIVNGALERVDQPVPLQPGGKLVCSPWSARFTVPLDGEATGDEDRLLVVARAGATGRDLVTYSIEILQRRED
jgi:hypothetical protein